MVANHLQMREAHVEQMKGYFASMYVGLDLSECKIEEVAKPEEEDDDDNDDVDAEDDGEDPFGGDESSEDDPFLDDPLLDYPGESNDIGGPSQGCSRALTLAVASLHLGALCSGRAAGG